MKNPNLYRPNVGIVLIDKDGKVFVGNRADIEKEAWQMPQGGIDEGEDIITAAKRELYEETNIKDDDIEFIKQSNDWLYYDYPENAIKNNKYIRAEKYKGQKQKWVIFRFIGDKDKIDINKAHHKEFKDYKWMDPDEVLRVVIDFRKPIYEKVFSLLKA